MSVPDGQRVELYVYYQLPRPDAAISRAEVAQLQERLRAALPGLQARCLERIDTSTSTLMTWMETYCHPQGLASAACLLIEQSAAEVPAARVGVRHIEVFDAQSPLG